MKVTEDGQLKIDITKVMEVDGQKARDVAVEEILQELMQVLGHSFSYFDFLTARGTAIGIWFNKIKKEG